MRSQLAVRVGSQEPVIYHQPPGVVSLAAAEEAIELADAYGICDGNPLAESQKITLRNGLGERSDGSWAATTIADFGPRQGTGKNDKIAARELAGLILFGDRLQIHTAHEFPTANESFLRLVSVFENYDDLRKKVARIRYANGEQGIELLSGQRLKYRARTGGSGRGFAKADLIVYDEAQHLSREHVAASGPAKLANPNSQTWYAGSGGLSTSAVAWNLRRQAILKTGGRMAYTEMTAEVIEVIAGKIKTTAPDPSDIEAWYRSMPGLGQWVTEEGMWALHDELAELFSRECLCVWEPEPTEQKDAKLPAEAWERTAQAVKPVDPVQMAYDVDIDGRSASISVASGTLADPVVEVIRHQSGVGWLGPELVDLVKKWKITTVVGCNGAGPAGAQVGAVQLALQNAHLKVEVKLFNQQQYQAACGGFYTDVIEGRLKRPPDGPLTLAGEDATERPLVESWVWDRRQATVPISPLVSATIARALLPERKPKKSNVLHRA